MKKKFSQLIASAVAYFIIAAIILGVIAVIAVHSSGYGHNGLFYGQCNGPGSVDPGDCHSLFSDLH